MGKEFELPKGQEVKTVRTVLIGGDVHRAWSTCSERVRKYVGLGYELGGSIYLTKEERLVKSREQVTLLEEICKPENQGEFSAYMNYLRVRDTRERKLTK
jgi:hypothetical protein